MHRKPSGLSPTPRGFTLVELLAVIFIIGLLIGILLPSVQTARNAAKNVKVKAQIKAISSALETFRSDNEKEFRVTNGYPTSAFVDDVTTAGANNLMAGSMWLPFYLMGKDLKGFVPKRAIPPDLVDEPEKWYLPNATSNGPLERAPVYLAADDVELKLPGQIGGNFLDIAADFGDATTAAQQPMIVDVYNRPILYYQANHLAKPGFNALARQDDSTTSTIGSYTHEDNAAITGDGTAGEFLGWNFGGGTHKIAEFGKVNGANIGDDANTFCWYILDKNAFETSQARLAGGSLDDATVQAAQRTSFLLMSPGLDGIYGTPDDIPNFDR
jgi:prepilin-type N-terminal cleavage/methylation domain-containing protein